MSQAAIGELEGLSQDQASPTPHERSPLFIASRARTTEDPACPDFDLGEARRRDVRALSALWRLTPAHRDSVRRRMMAICEKAKDPRARVAAANALIAMQGQDLADLHHQEGSKLAVQVTDNRPLQERVDATLQRVEQIIRQRTGLLPAVSQPRATVEQPDTREPGAVAK